MTTESAALQQGPPPSKANLRAWWNHFTFAQRAKKDAEAHKEEEHTVFGKPLRESLRYASVQISTANANGELYVWGYIPVVVAKCGLYLKENATEVEGTFRVNGSNKRMRELQAEFERSPRYGKSLDWKNENYTAHDVASVFRRYLTMMPEPVIPYDMYHEFRDTLAKKPFKQDEVIATYKRLIRSMPRANQYLLLYVLDLLSVFARKSDKNLMTASNLAVIFRPGLISHPNHEMSPKEHELSQKVLEFLIAQQDWFMLDIPPPPQSGPSGSPSSGRSTGHSRRVISVDDDDILVTPSSDDDQSQLGGGWKLVGKERKRITRRRTTLDNSEVSDSGRSKEGGDLSPVAERTPTPSTEGGGALGVRRSRTLPSSRGEKTPPESKTPAEPSSSAPSDDEKRARVLRKQRRASGQTAQAREPRAPTSPAPA